MNGVTKRHHETGSVQEMKLVLVLWQEAVGIADCSQRSSNSEKIVTVCVVCVCGLCVCVCGVWCV